MFANSLPNLNLLINQRIKREEEINLSKSKSIAFNSSNHPLFNIWNYSRKQEFIFTNVYMVGVFFYIVYFTINLVISPFVIKNLLNQNDREVFFGINIQMFGHGSPLETIDRYSITIIFKLFCCPLVYFKSTKHK